MQSAPETAKEWGGFSFAHGLSHAREVLRSVDVPYVVLDPAHRIVEANESFYRVFGLTLQQTAGCSFFEVGKRRWDVPAYHRLLESVLSDDVPFVEIEDARDASPGVPRTLVVSLRRLARTAGQPPLFLVDFEDVTQRTRQIRELRQKALEAERSNHDLEQFAYVASHDLQEPLRMMAAYSQLLSKKYAGRLDPQADKYLHYVLDGALRMQQLVNDLLAYARVATQPAALAPVDLNVVLQQALGNLRLQLHETQATVQAASMPTIAGDRSQLAQVFQNLISNALKFHGSDPPRLDILATDLGRRVQLRFKDNGIGIPPEMQAKLFRPFQRLHGRLEYPGNGIGLAMAKRIIERHGGTIRIESDGANGTTFIIELPQETFETP